MAISTQTLADASFFLSTVLVDQVQVFDVGGPVTVGTSVSRTLHSVGQAIPALVQTTVLPNTAESQTENVYSVKVAQGTPIKAGQAVRVVACAQEPDLVGKTLLLDKVSQNGLAVIRKAVASDFTQVDQQGKGGLSG